MDIGKVSKITKGGTTMKSKKQPPMSCPNAFGPCPAPTICSPHGCQKGHSIVTRMFTTPDICNTIRYYTSLGCRITFEGQEAHCCISMRKNEFKATQMMINELAWTSEDIDRVLKNLFKSLKSRIDAKV